jgi:hypothetical protein
MVLLYRNVAVPAAAKFLVNTYCRMVYRPPLWVVLVPSRIHNLALYKKKIPITLKCRHMHGVLNVDEIKKLIT